MFSVLNPSPTTSKQPGFWTSSPFFFVCHVAHVAFPWSSNNWMKFCVDFSAHAATHPPLESLGQLTGTAGRVRTDQHLMQQRPIHGPGETKLKETDQHLIFLHRPTNQGDTKLRTQFTQASGVMPCKGLLCNERVIHSKKKHTVASYLWDTVRDTCIICIHYLISI